MPFQRPTLTDLRNQVDTDIQSNLTGGPVLRFANEKIIGKAVAGLSHLHYGYLDWIAKQAVPFTATDEYLEGWAGLKGVIRNPATPATGSAAFNGTAGSVIPAGSLISRGDGYEYTTNADATISAGGSVTVAITAVLPTIDPVTNPTGNGALGNADAGTPLTLGVAIPGVQSNGAAATALTGGADIETNDSLRSRMLAQYQSTPQGGAQNDYLTWALAVSGVTRAWVTPNGFGAGTVVIYVMLDVSQAAHNGFPQGSDGVATNETRGIGATGDQLTVANAIYPQQPVTALVYVCAPTADPINFTIYGISGASSATKTAVANAITGVFTAKGDPRGGTVNLSDIEAAISAISGIAGFVIASPTGNITNSTGQLPTLGAITYA